ncbi:NADPH-dependent F420 reductase [Streptomyces albipurpureus]|uniref:NAD(P)-binding domain-containing protein n=1 Tax=Streptomyces albipurpureus TaxID=2897419 RepID=A0ABT0US96_9ACTN|nr:NAD(P)-binding domain-containing protein [Streptomyces sp. CWNU-1]MCM2391428.1 NAD(P)-binding domain-containing protein [Streptomyces sp. CWNU-1]
MTKIGFIGTGNVARAVAIQAAAVGHDVVFGSRDPDRKRDLDLPVVSLAEAIDHSDIVVNATPGTESLALLTPFGPKLAGKVLLDIAVGLTESWDLAHPNSSIGEQIQQALPDTKVVKTLCTMDATVMVAPNSLTGPSTVFLSGDDAGAKTQVSAFLRDLGWTDDTQLDIGGITTSRGQEHLALLFIGVAQALDSHTFNFAVVRSSGQSSGA